MKSFDTQELKISKYSIEEILKGKNIDSVDIDNLQIIYRYPTNQEHLNLKVFADWEIDMFCSFHGKENRPKPDEKFIIKFNN